MAIDFTLERSERVGTVIDVGGIHDGGVFPQQEALVRRAVDDVLESPNDQPQLTATETHHHCLLEQQFDGARIAAGETIPCRDCGDHLHEGRPISARACRYSDEPVYTIAAIYCADCAPTDLTETAPGRVDVLLEADLGLAMAGQTHWTILVDPTVVATA
ncbi:hypothetical protein [Natrinema gelatinilyticum]|uniref:hypothetical protein n=1 Tax=Natrinema gelatinilyticum TaxID=2961571 RepID=UPI0020C210A7|nr:hypothetical protein [Natrinema gelatinilyticum]